MEKSNVKTALIQISTLLDNVESVADTLSLISESSSADCDSRLSNALTLQINELYNVYEEVKAICNANLLNNNGGKTLKELRESSGLDIEAVSKAIDVCPAVLMSWELGESYPTLPEITKLEKVYGTTYNDMKFIPC